MTRLAGRAGPPRATRRRALQWLLAASVALTTIHVQPSARRALALMGSEASVTANTFGTVALGEPTALVGQPQGHDVSLNWTAGANGTGYVIAGVANGASSECGLATFADIGTSAAAAYTDASRYAPPGTWFCYETATTASTWRSQQNNPVTAVQIGFVANSVVVTNGSDTSACNEEQVGVSGELDCGDQIVIGFNQPVLTSTGPAVAHSVCADDEGETLWLGSVITLGACSAAEPTSLGLLTGSSVGGCNCRFSASYSWDAEGRWLTVTIGHKTAGDGHPTLGGTSWTFKPTTDPDYLLSATGELHVCDADSGGSRCWPTTP